MSIVGLLFVHIMIFLLGTFFIFIFWLLIAYPHDGEERFANSNWVTPLYSSALIVETISVAITAYLLWMKNKPD